VSLRLQKLQELKNALMFNEDALYIPNFIENPERFATWEQIQSCLTQCNYFSCAYITKRHEKEDVPVIVSINQKHPNEDTPAKNRSVLSMKYSYDAESMLKEDKSILITNFEKANSECKLFISELLKTFYLDYDSYGVWPAQIGGKSGHAHVYCGSENSSSFSPHTDEPHNFIIQVEGESKFTTYRNRVFGLGDHGQAIADMTSEEKKAMYDDLEVSGEYLMKPGDLIYVPSRQFHYVEPVTKRISVSFPLILKQPSSW